jgi:dTDP-4-dehydrorhamnose 3,5-epimerase
MKLRPTPLDGVIVAESLRRTDPRGSFARLFCEDDLRMALRNRRIVQINHSLTLQRGTIRGLHYQNKPFGEMKLIRCIRGHVWDVAVDLRAGSPTFLQSYAIELSPDNARMLVVPEGCAHGFQALAPASELLYLHTARHSAESEAGIAWDDERLAIAWPLAVPVGDAGLSERDRSLPPITSAFAGLPT